MHDTARGGADNARQSMRSHVITCDCMQCPIIHCNHVQCCNISHAITCNEEAAQVLLPQQRWEYDNIRCHPLRDKGRSRPCLVIRGSINYFGQKKFAPNAIFRVLSCLYILYDLTFSIWLNNSTRSHSYEA